MFGLIVLFGLAVWVGITVLLTVNAYRSGKTPIRKVACGFLAFMLTMGGWIVYWAVEYMSIQAKVSQLCQTESGVKVYVTPEEWRKQIGEEEWNTLKFSGKSSFKIKEDFNYNKKIFHSSSKINRRIYGYDNFESIPPNINSINIIYVDKLTNKVLIEVKDFSVIHQSLDTSIGGLKFWLTNIKDCPFNKKMPNYDIIYQYSSSQPGEKL